MLKKILNETSRFDFYFKEADGDDDSVSVKVVPREDRGTDYNDDSTNVNVAPRSNRGTDYNADDNEESDNDTDTQSENPSDSDDNSNDNNENDNETGNEPDTEDDEDGDAPAEPDADDGTDYNNDSSDDSSSDSTDDNSSDNTNTESGDGDKRKKYSTYLRYLKLYDMLETFSDKLQSVIKDDPSQNAVINKVVDNFSELHDGMYEYMTIKYMNASYVEVVIYFETVVNCIRLNFELLRNNKINLKQ